MHQTALTLNADVTFSVRSQYLWYVGILTRNLNL